MSTLSDLRKLVASADRLRVTGTIIEALPDSRYRVRAARGDAEAVAVSGLAFRVGDEVLIQDGIILGRVKSAAAVKVYSV